jgi:hypothetical protein
MLVSRKTLMVYLWNGPCVRACRMSSLLSLSLVARLERMPRKSTQVCGAHKNRGEMTANYRYTNEVALLKIQHGMHSKDRMVR